MRIQDAAGVAREDRRRDIREIARLENDCNLVRLGEVSVVKRDFTIEELEAAARMRAVPADDFKTIEGLVGKRGSQEFAQALLVSFGEDEARAE